MDWRRTMREFVRASRPPNAAAVAAAKLRRRVHQAEAGAVTAAGAASVGGGFGDGGGGGGGGSGGGTWQSGEATGLTGDSNNENFTDYFAGFLDPWWSVWKGDTPAVANGLLTWTTVGVGDPAHVLAYNAAEFTDATVSAEVTAGETLAAVFARGSLVAGELSGYVARAGPAGVLTLYRFAAGVPTTLGFNFPTGFSAGDALGIECEGTAVRLLKNGATIISVVDATYASGSVGLAKWNTAGTLSFEYFTVASL